MKFGFKLNNIQLGEVKIGAIEFNTEFSINEMIATRKEVEHILENAPTYIHQIADAAVTFNNIDNQMEDMAREEQVENMVKQITHDAKVKAIMDLFAQG